MKTLRVLQVTIIIAAMVLSFEGSLEAKAVTGTSQVTVTLPEIANIVITQGNPTEIIPEADLLAIYNAGGGLYALTSTITVRLVTNSAWQLAVKVNSITKPTGATTAAADFKIKHDQSAYYHTGFAVGFNDLSLSDIIIASSAIIRLTAGQDFAVNHALYLSGNEPLGDYVFSLTYTLTSPL